MAGEASEASIAAFLTALRVKGETADELAGAVEAVRAHGSGIRTRDEPADGPRRAAARHLRDGGRRRRHGECLDGHGARRRGLRRARRQAWQPFGLGQLGQRRGPDRAGCRHRGAQPDVLSRCLATLGITFLFAPAFHPALRFAAPGAAAVALSDAVQPGRPAGEPRPARIPARRSGRATARPSSWPRRWSGWASAARRS